MECKMCGSFINNGDSICRVCGSPVVNKEKVNNNINNQNNYNRGITTNNNQMNNNVVKPCDFICPHCGIKIPENQLYQFIKRNGSYQSQINNVGVNYNKQVPNFNNLSGIFNNNPSNDLYSNFSNNDGEF